jgi:hypothetical protein
VKEGGGVNVTRIAGICSVLVCFLTMALEASGDGGRSNAPACAAAATNASRSFSNVTKVAVSLDDMVASNKLLEAANKDKPVALKEKIAVAKVKKATPAKPQKQVKVAKKADDTPKSDATGWISWIWSDPPGAPSVRSNCSGGFPRFK